MFDSETIIRIDICLCNISINSHGYNFVSLTKKINAKNCILMYYNEMIEVVHKLL